MEGEEEGENPFTPQDNLGDGADEEDLGLRAAQSLREKLELKGASNAVFRKVPFFLGHGAQDEKVHVELGRAARVTLQNLGAAVKWKEYAALGHWHSDEMLADVLESLKTLEWETG